MSDLTLRYKTPAPDNDQGWENRSLPLGNGYFGVNFFGLVESERLQITENSVQTRHNLTDAAELRLLFPHTFSEVTGYECGLNLEQALGYVKYDCGGVHYEREYLTSFPAGVLAIRLTCDKESALSFAVRLDVPFTEPFGTGNGYGRTGETVFTGDGIKTLSHLEYYNILLSSQIRVLTDGALTKEDNTLAVTGAKEAVLYFSCGTNYVLTPRCFTEEDPQKKIDLTDPTERVAAKVDGAAMLGIGGYETIRAAHIADYRGLFGRVSLSLGTQEVEDPRLAGLMTDELLNFYQHDVRSHRLEELYFQYGRYMLICSSRPGTLPPNLQGIWNCYRSSPWGSGYWHNINVQMNYWPCFSGNLAELFQSYSDLNHAFRQSAEAAAVEYAKSLDLYDENETEYGWTVGTAVRAYEPGGFPSHHSGPGTGAMTAKLFYDWWDFTRDPELLKNQIYPTIHGLTKSLIRSVEPIDGEYLSKFSASPEQVVRVIPWDPNEGSIWTSKSFSYYHTVGCAFDQQMIAENSGDDLKCAALLGFTDRFTKQLEKQEGKYHPVEIGLSGQIKEYREEQYYGEIGETNHRHISQLVGLVPGTMISRDTPAWLDAARRTLHFRTDESTGWALAHRLNAWARTGDGNRSYKLLNQLIGKRTFENLWDAHPPFQIDGNFGGTSGMIEMLLQSQTGIVELLPSLPDAWADGSFEGLVARGNFEISASWKNRQVQEIRIHSRAGSPIRIRSPRIAEATVTDQNGNVIAAVKEAKDLIAFPTEKDGVYTITDIPTARRIHAPKNPTVSGRTPHLVWEPSSDENVTYTVYCNRDSRPDYEIVASQLRACEFVDFSYHPSKGGYTMYRIVAVSDDPETYESDSAVCVIVDEDRKKAADNR